MAEFRKPGIRVLVVEDESIVALDLERSLKRMGYEVVGVVQSGEDAVRKAEEARPTIVFMDIRLRGAMSGVDAAREIRRRQGIPVIYLTAYSDEETLQRAKETEPYGYLLKPFDESDLRTALEVALHKHRIEAEEAAAMSKALAESEEKFRLLVENVKDYAIFMLDAKGAIASWNSGAERIFGYSPEEVIGKEPTLFFSEEPPLAASIFREILRTCEREGRFEAEAQRVRKDGAAFWAGISITPVRDADSSLRGYSVVTQDVTERKHLIDELREAIRSRDEFLSIASHELRTPLTGLQLRLQLLSRELKELGDSAAGKLADSVMLCQKQGARIGDLIDELLDLTRIRLGKLSLQKEMTDLSELAREALERLRMEVGGVPRISFYSTGKARGLWDRSRIEQVLMNLLTNAVKYGEGKPIEVNVREAPETREVLLQVRDQGMGIAPEMQGRIFERFERAVGPSKISGLGLGLYITRQIVEGHGGRIGVESEPGKGSTFTVTLPATLGEEAA